LIDDYLTDWRSLNWRSKLIWLAVEKPDLNLLLNQCWD